MERAHKGDGHLYRRGRVWWIQYYEYGRRYQESSGETDRRLAEKALQERLADIRRDRFSPPAASKVTAKQILDDLVTDYEMNGRDSLPRAKGAIRHLLAYFGESTKVRAITGPRLNHYVLERKEESAENATIRYELAILRRAFRLQVRAGILSQMPPFPAIEVNNARKGFLEEGDHRAILSHLGEDLAAACEFAWWTGWRLRSEILPLTWTNVDLQAGVVRLEPGTTKNDDGREFPFTSESPLHMLLAQQRTNARGQFVFFRVATGRKIDYRTFMEAWHKARKAANLEHLVPHDYRRSAVRRLELAGVPRAHAMRLVGHKTESMYRRYSISTREDLRTATQKAFDYSLTTVEEGDD